MADKLPMIDTGIIIPPLIQGAVHPDAEAAEICARLRGEGARVGIKDLNAELSYDYIYKQDIFTGFKAKHESLEKRGEPLPRFPGLLRPDSLFAKKTLRECEIAELEQSAFEDFATHSFYLEMVCRAFGISSGHSATFEAMGAKNEFLESFYRHALVDLFEHGNPSTASIIVRAASQLQPAVQLGSFLREKYPDMQILLSLPAPSAENNLAKEISARFDMFDLVTGSFAEFTEAIIKAIPHDEVATKQHQESSDAHGFPLHLYPARLIPIRVQGDAVAAVRTMRVQYEKTGYDTFLFLGAGPETLGAISDEITKTEFYFQWSAECDFRGACSPELCGRLFRSGCRYVFIDVAGNPAEKEIDRAVIDCCAAFSGAGICVDATVAVSSHISPEELSQIHKKFLERQDIFNDISFRFENTELKHIDEALPENILIYSAKAIHATSYHAQISEIPENNTTLQIHGEPEIECASRENRRRAGLAREAVVLCYICLDIERPQYVNPPLAMLYLEAYAGRDPAISDHFEFHHRILHPSEGIEECAAKILSARPAVIGFSCYVWNVELTMELCARLKQAAPDVTVILGGPETLEPEPLLRACPAIDGIVRGEGEIPFYEILLSRIRNGGNGLGENITALSFRKNDDFLHTAPDFAVTPVRDLPAVFTPQILRRSSPNSPLYFETSRGCVNNCAYCSWTMKPRLRNYRLERIENDIEAILLNRKIHSRLMIYFTDAQLNIDLARMKRILRAIIKNNKIGHRFETTVNLERIDREAAELMRDAPFNHPYIGLETIHEDTLRNAGRRPLDTAAAEKALAHLRETGLLDNTITSVIIGLPGDNYEKYFKTLEWCWKHDLYVFPFTLWVLPGTRFSRDAARFGIERQPRPPHAILATSSFPSEQIVSAERLSLNYVVLYNLLKISGIRFLKANGIGLPGMAEAFRLDDGFYNQRGFHILENTGAFLDAHAGSAMLEALAACGRQLKLSAKLKEALAGVFQYRVMEHSLKRRLEEKKIMLRDNRPGPARYVAGACARLSLKRNILPIVRGEALDLRSVPDEPFEGAFFINVRNNEISIPNDEVAGVQAALMELMDAAGGATIGELAKGVRDKFPGMSEREVAAAADRLLDGKFCMKT